MSEQKKEKEQKEWGDFPSPSSPSSPPSTPPSTHFLRKAEGEDEEDAYEDGWWEGKEKERLVSVEVEMNDLAPTQKLSRFGMTVVVL